jgi:hypothetical protein
MTELSTDAILMLLNDYAERHLETSLVYQVAKADLQALLDEITRLQADRDRWIKVADDLYLIHDDCPRDLTAPQANSHQWNEIINNYFEAKGID